MKLIYLTVLMSLSTIIVFAQNIFPAAGNVGIGTLSPVGNLDIFDNRNMLTIPLISIRSNFHVLGNYGMIKFGDYTQTTDYQKGAIIYESVAGSARGKFHLALENTDGPGSVTIADARFTVLSNGNIGVGIVNPNEKLAVNGIIRAREVKVTTTDWPDYVFQASYQLPTLAQIEQQIKLYGHLPDMPSAKEVEANGIALGEMNKLLLKKVEELTLHLIEKDKQMAQEKLVNKAQQIQLERLLKDVTLLKTTIKP